MPRLRALVAEASARLAQAGVPSPEHDARELAAFALGLDRFPADVDHVSADQASRFESLVRRREAREPLQHLVGSTVFRYAKLTVRAGVFVPRPETEVVAQVAIDEATTLVDAGRDPVVIDLCCGAGAIGVSVATEVPRAVVHAVDVSREAVDLAVANREAAGASNLSVALGDARDADLLKDLEGMVDVVVSNPPYIPAGAIPLDPEVRHYDPPAALFGGGEDGLDLPRAVMAAAVRLLRPGGLFVMEHADVQGAATRELAAEAGLFTSFETRRDLTGRDRMLVARRR